MLWRGQDQLPTFVVSFDGGARHKSPQHCLPESGPRVAGVGAAIWGPPDDRGRRQCIAQATIACPNLGDSMSAEAAGLRLGIALVVRTLPHAASVGILGDNLPVMRLGAGNGKIRTPGIWEILEAPLLHIAVREWRCQWFAVRRRYNKSADALATLGTYRAIERAATGQCEPDIHIWSTYPEARDGQPLPWHSDWEVTHSANPLSSLGLQNGPEAPETHGRI